MGKNVARRKAECLVDVSLGFCASTEKKLGGPDDIPGSRHNPKILG
jgi:hypothetical protein